MRMVICWLLVVALLTPTAVLCAERGAVASFGGEGRRDGTGAASGDTGLVSDVGEDTTGVVMGSEDDSWLRVFYELYKIIRNGVVYDVVKRVVRRVAESAPVPNAANHGGWPDDQPYGGCGMK